MKCQMIFSQDDFLGHSKIHSGQTTFFIPQIHKKKFRFVPAISTSVYEKKTHSDQVADARRDVDHHDDETTSARLDYERACKKKDIDQ
jgi:hypothetical protein